MHEAQSVLLNNIRSELLRYILISGGLYLCLDFIFQKYFREDNVRTQKPNEGDIFRELILSLANIIIIPLVGMIPSFYFIKYTKLYSSVGEYGLIWLPISLLLLIVIYDTYFYWCHRLFHSEFLYNKFHYLHHRSLNPTPLATHSFHPIEALFHSVFWILPVIFIIPLHPYILLIFAILNSTLNALGHSGINLYPKKFREHQWGKFLSAPSAHYLHHHHENFNFGFYFRFWDFFFKTNHEQFKKN